MAKKFLLFIWLIFPGYLSAQQAYKIGHINTQELYTLMPEWGVAKNTIDKVILEYQDYLETIQTEFQGKYQEYLMKNENYSKTYKQLKEEELQELNDRIEQFQAKAQKEIEFKQAELFNPLMDKAQKAISDVAIENKFTYILDISSGIVLYKANNSNDILPLVKAKMGIK
jgi:outer membrane protein